MTRDGSYRSSALPFLLSQRTTLQAQLAAVASSRQADILSAVW